MGGFKNLVRTEKLSTNIETLVDWLDNGRSPWSALHEFVSDRLIALNKQPGVRSSRIGETWRRLFEKCVLRVMVPETTSTCQDYQLCVGLKAGIDSNVHRVQAIWDTKSTREDWGFLLVDPKNAFNEINWIGMLWTVCHLWPSGAHFDFNCYYHWSLLVLRNRNRTSILCTLGRYWSRGNHYPWSPMV